MDDKTEELRDIFVEVTEEETVTESQTEQRGSLLRDGSVEERLGDVVERMRDYFEFDTDLETEALCRIITAFYDDESDADIAANLEVDTERVVEARLDLHLVREGDTAVDVPDLRDRLDAGESVVDVAEACDTQPATVERAARALQAEQRASRVGQRFRTEFEEVLTDADIAVRLTADVQKDGLEEATEGMEVDVDF